jgi:hypothetical protein
MNMSPMELEVLRKERLLAVERNIRNQGYDNFSTAPQNTFVSGLIDQAKQWIQARQFRNSSTRRAHAV